jgi:hypothetical protein
MRIPKNQISINNNPTSLSYDSSGLKHSGPSYQINGVNYSGEYKNNHSPVSSLLIPEKNNVKSSIISKFGYGTEQYKRSINNNYFAASLITKPANNIKTNTKNLKGIKYYYKNNSNIIKEISYNEYISWSKSGNPLIKLTKLDFNSSNIENDINQSEKQIPGLRLFLGL